MMQRRLTDSHPALPNASTNQLTKIAPRNVHPSVLTNWPKSEPGPEPLTIPRSEPVSSTTESHVESMERKSTSRIGNTKISSAHKNASRAKRYCTEDGCTNLARSFGLCKRHGGQRVCIVEDCTNLVESMSKCIKHGGAIACRFENCIKSAQSKGLCKSHGGAKTCEVSGCVKRAYRQRKCRGHAEIKDCSIKGCEKARKSITSLTCKYHTSN